MTRGMWVLVLAVVLAAAGCGSSGDEPSATVRPGAESGSGAGSMSGSGDESGSGLGSDEPSGGMAPATGAPGEPTAAPEPAAADASPYVEGFGDLSGVSLPAGDPGAVSIVASGTTIDPRGSVALVVRNNTGEAVGNIEATGTARDDAGTLVGSGTSQGFQPKVVAPGEIAYGYVYFDTTLTGSAFDYDINVTAQPPDDYFVPVSVNEVNNTGDQIIGTVANDGDTEVNGPIRVETICFDPDGSFRVNADSYVEPYDLPAAGTGAFTIDLFNGACPVGLIAASGYGG